MGKFRKVLFAIEVLVVIVLSVLEIRQMIIKANPDPDILLVILLLGGFVSIITKNSGFNKRMGYSLCYFGILSGVFAFYYSVFAFLANAVMYGIFYAILGLILACVLIFIGKDLLKLK